MEDFIQQDFENIKQIICQRFRQISDVILFLNEKKAYNNQIIGYELFTKIITSEKLDFGILSHIVKLICDYEKNIEPENIILFVSGRRYYTNGNNIIEDDFMGSLSSDVSESPLLIQENPSKTDKCSNQGYSNSNQGYSKLPFQGNDCDLDKDFFEDSEGYYIESSLDLPYFDGYVSGSSLSEYHNKLIQNPDLMHENPDYLFNMNGIILNQNMSIEDKNIGPIDINRLVSDIGKCKYELTILNCQINDLMLGFCHYFEKVVIKRCFIYTCCFQAGFFLKGLTIENCHIVGEADFSSFGHNKGDSPIIINKNLFEKFVCFEDSQFEGPFYLTGNRFLVGTDILLEQQLQTDFVTPPVIDGNEGDLKYNPKLR